MSLSQITQLIIEYRYWILVPLSLIEGPIVAFAAATLASLGYFNVFVLGLFFFVRDMGMDGFYYSIGYWGIRGSFVKRALKRVGVEESHFEAIRILWEKKPGRTMFLGKLSYGIASSFVVLAGSVHMSLKKFFGWGALVACVEYGSLLCLGFFFGAAFTSGQVSILEDVLYAIGGITFVAGLYYALSFYLKNHFKGTLRNNITPSDTSGE